MLNFENVRSHFVNMFLNPDDAQILLPWGMCFEPESKPGHNQTLISYKLPLTFCCTKATSQAFCFPIYLR